MTSIRLVACCATLALLAFNQPAEAQPYSPYPPQPGAEPAPQQAPPDGFGLAQGQAQAQPGASWSAQGQYDFGLAPVAADEPPAGDLVEAEREHRTKSLASRNGLGSSVGVLRVSEAGAGAAGTFRVGFIGSWFSSTGYLCNGSSPCPTLAQEAPQASDEAERVGGHFFASATPLPFLEAYVGLHNSSTSNTRSRPQLLQVLGDTNLGVKGFMPWEPDQIFAAGGQLDLLLLNGTGGVGLEGSGTSFGVKALSTLDLSNRSDPEGQVPLRFHANVGYLFDNSARVVEGLESSQPPVGRNARVSRIERFGLDLNRVDNFGIGLAAEYLHPAVRPFLEWTIEIPTNRQGHVCNVTRASAQGDLCLGRAAGFSTTASRLGLGASVYPWQGQGLALTGAWEIATSGASTFIEETAPEPPWNLYFGLGFAFDTRKPAPIIERVEAPAAAESAPQPTRYVVSGVVVEKGSLTPIANALVRYEGRDLTGMISDANGRFRTADLEPGQYTFSVQAQGYRAGTCAVTIQTGAPVGPGPAAPGYPDPGYQYTPPIYTPPVVPQSQLPEGARHLFGMPGAKLAQYDGQWGTRPATSPYFPPGAPPPPGADPQYSAGAPQQPPPGSPHPDVPGAAGVPPAQAAPQKEPIVFQVQCELEPLPKVGSITGSLLDGDTGSPIGNARLTIRDRLGRTLELRTDASGSFRFENVLPGRALITAEASGYLMSAREYEVLAQKDLDARLSLHAQSSRPRLALTNNDVRLRDPIDFEDGSSELLPQAYPVISELAQLLKDRSDLRVVEIQGHLDSSTSPLTSQRLSQSRAEAVATALKHLGISEDRLEARGYGAEKPLVPNTTEANQARNRRIQVVVKQRGR